MQNPLEITFHDLERNTAIEELIKDKLEKLFKIRPDITKCHVFLEKQSKHHQKANSTLIRLDIKVPHFEDIFVSEKCSEDIPSLKTTVIKVFKRGQDLLLERIKYNRDRGRVAGRKDVVVSIPDEETEEE